MTKRSEHAVYHLAIAAVTALVIANSQTHAFAWDEGFHLLTAQLILHGKRPYIDFCFSQTPLSAYWNALWMRLFGDTWKTPHLAAALCSSAAIWLTADFVRSRFPVPQWRLPGAVAAASFVGLNLLVFQFGGVAQAYAFGMLALVAAYRFTILRNAALAGLFCGIAINGTLLTTPAAPVMLFWVLWRGASAQRWKQLAAFASGAFLAFVPLLNLARQGPRQVWFGIWEYNFSFRQVGWPGATQHNLVVYSNAIGNGPALLLILFAIGGLLFVRFRSDWDAGAKAELYLCAWLIVALAVFISTARPTFERYYIFTVPFLAILGVAGLYALSTAVYKPDRPWLPVAILSTVLACGIAKAAYAVSDDLAWPDLEITAAKVNEITAPNQRLFADEAIYFLTRRTPPSGMEMRDSHKFDLPADRLALLHLIPEAELNRQVKANQFDVLETCEDDDITGEHHYSAPYANSAKAGECNVFWSLRSHNRH